MDDLSRRQVKVYRAADMHLIARGEVGRLVPPDGPAYGASNLQSIVAHCNVPDPWQLVPAGETLPANVQAAIDDTAGWEPPSWPISRGTGSAG